MSTTPPRRRRHSPAVYRRRRLVLLLALVLIGALVWLLIAQPWRGAAAESEAAAKTPKPSATSSAPLVVPDTTGSGAASDLTNGETANAAPDDSGGSAATSSPETASTPNLTPAAEPCVTSDLTVEAVTDKESYAQNENPQLSIRLTNSSASDCALNVGTSSQRFTVDSGGDTWWRSTDCQEQPSDMLVLLTAGQSVVSATPLTWDRTRSAVGTCDATDRPRAPGGGSTYHLTVEIGGVQSAQSTSFMLY